MSDLFIRISKAADIPAILSLIDGGAAEPGKNIPNDGSNPAILMAFEAITSDENNELIVGEINGEVVCTTQITYIPGMAYGGAWRAMFESVHVRSDQRGKGTGTRLMQWAIERSRSRGCDRVQLTSNKLRSDAHRFYENLGFIRSHEGCKLLL